MTESWIKEICPECRSINWFCLGDLEDLSKIDIDVLQCRDCSHRWAGGEEIDDDAWAIEFGQEAPS